MSLLFKSLQKNTSRPHTITRTVFFFQYYNQIWIAQKYIIYKWKYFFDKDLQLITERRNKI